MLLTTTTRKEAYRDVRYFVMIADGRRVTHWKTAGRPWLAIRAAPPHLIAALRAGIVIRNRRVTKEGYEQGEVMVRTSITRQAAWKRRRRQ